jgi:transcriptional regulator with XRE-family HTH domain
MFSFALLAKENLTEEELRGERVYLMSLNDLRREFNQCDLGAEIPAVNRLRGINSSVTALNRTFMLSSLPSVVLASRLEPVLNQPFLEVLLLPSEAGSLVSRINEWHNSMAVNLADNSTILSALGNNGTELKVPELPPRIVQNPPQKLHVESAGREQVQSGDTSIWNPPTQLEEATRLLQEDEMEETLILAPRDISEEKEGHDEEIIDQPWIDEAIEIKLSGGWYSLLAADETINVICSGSDGEQVEERFIRSLRPGDRVLFIHGQRRQSLYELVISRVHRHQSMELHLALIQRWQEDLIGGYKQRLKADGLSLDELLKKLQMRGSQLTSPYTIHLWLRRYIMCPNDPEDLRRIAQELELPFAVQYYKRIHTAARRIAGIHRVLARRLNRWIRDAASGAGDSDDLVDSELGLTFQDFRNSLLILRVESVSHKSGPFFRQGLGLLERASL